MSSLLYYGDGVNATPDGVLLDNDKPVAVAEIKYTKSASIKKVLDSATRQLHIAMKATGCGSGFVVIGVPGDAQEIVPNIHHFTLDNSVDTTLLEKVINQKDFLLRFLGPLPHADVRRAIIDMYKDVGIEDM